MKVMVMSCSDKSFWYKNNIGKIFNVLNSDVSRVYVKGKDSKAVISILKADCEVIEK